MQPNLGIDDANRGAVLRLLDGLLADEVVLAARARNYHWNVVGPQFGDLHRTFARQHRALAQLADDVAGRVRALGGRPLGTLTEFLRHTRFLEQTGRIPAARDMVADLLADHETLVRRLREERAACLGNHQDAGTAHCLTDWMVRHEKLAGLLRAFLEAPAG